MDYPQSDYIDLFNLIEKLRGDIEVLQKEIDGEEPFDDDMDDIEE